MAKYEMSGCTQNWQKGKSMIESLRFSLQKHIFCDVTFTVGQQRKCIEAHRLILSLRSSVFFDLITELLPQQGYISIPDIEPDIFEAFLTFVYTDDVIITGSNVTGLLYASKKYEITDLTNKCLAFMESSLTSCNVCVFLEQAHLYTEEDLMKKCLTFICENGEDVLKSDSFSDLCRDCFRKVIQPDDLNASEESVFETSMKWSETKCRRQQRAITPENRRQILDENLYLIRFPLLDSGYLHNNVFPTKLLTESERNKILRSFVYPNCDVSPFTSIRRSGNLKPIFISRFENFVHEELNRSGKCDEGIIFWLNTDALFQGLQLYGNPSNSSEKHTVSVSVCEMSTDEIVFESACLSTGSADTAFYDVNFPTPVQLHKYTKYNLIVRIKGVTYFKGVRGRWNVKSGNFTCVFSDYQKCKHSSVATNTTCVNEGQIPGLKFLI